jgi:hypothetical protein
VVARLKRSGRSICNEELAEGDDVAAAVGQSLFRLRPVAEAAGSIIVP